MCRSEIASIRQQIEVELDAMRRGMTGVAIGTSRHAFIHARMNRIGVCQDQLASQVGETVAKQIVCNLYIETMK